MMTSNLNKRNIDKRKRTVLTLSQKLEICRRIKAGVKRRDLMQEFNVGASTLYDIKSREDEWLSVVTEGECAGNRYTIRKPRMEELETVLVEWFQLKKSEGERVTGPMIIEKAKDLYDQMNLSEHCAFSSGWLTRFKNRHRITRVDLKSNVVKNSEEDLNSDLKTDGEMTTMEDFSNFIKSEIDLEAENDNNEYEVTWEAADLSFSNLLSFAENQQCFSKMDVIQLRRMYAAFLEKKNEHCLRRT